MAGIPLPSLALPATGKFELPPDHRPGMRVPKGGASCAKCKYYAGHNRCGNEYFQQWRGSDVIPAPPDQYCSDWFEPRGKV